MHILVMAMMSCWGCLEPTLRERELHKGLILPWSSSHSRAYWRPSSLVGVLPVGLQALRARDENGGETDGTECYHICFHIFLQKRKRIQKPRKWIPKQILPKTDTKRIQSGYGNRNRHWSEIKTPLNHREIHTKTNKFNELLTCLQNNTIMLAT